MSFKLPRATPLTTLALMVALLAAYAVEVSAAGTTEPAPDLLLALGAMNKAAVHEGDWFRLLSATLLHGGVAHLLFNCVALFLGGLLTERLVGRAWVFVIYTLSAIGGSLLGLVVNDSTVVSVGASGAIMGLFAASAVQSFRLPRGRPRSTLQIRVAQFIVPTLIPHSDRVLAGVMDIGKVDYSAHLGGALVGAVVGLFLLVVHPRDDHRVPLARTGLGLAGAAFLAFVVATFGVVRSYPALAATANLKADLLLAPDTSIPADSRRAESTVDAWGKDYPRDPRVHLYRGLARLDGQPAAAEQEFRAGLAEQAILHKFFDRHLEVVLRGALCSSLVEQDRRADAEREAQSICHDGPAGAVPDIIKQLSLCGAKP